MTNSTLPEWFDYLEFVVNYAFMFGSAITIPLYAMEILILISLRKSFYKGMFYQIFTIGITVDMISLINNYVGCVFPAKGWFSGFYLSFGTFVGHMYLIIAWTSRGIQGCTVVALAMNRVTAVCLPIKHKRIWNSKRARFIHVFQLGLGLMVGSSLLTQSFYWKFEYNGFYIQFSDPVFRLRFFVAAYVIETFLVLIIIILNITMLICFKKKYKMMNNTSQTGKRSIVSEKQRQENNLTTVAFLTCVAELIYYFYVVYVFGINTNVPTRVFYLLYETINDVYCGISGWLLLIYSKSMRNHILKFLRFPAFGCRQMRAMIPEHQLSSATNLDGAGKNFSSRRPASCGTPC